MWFEYTSINNWSDVYFIQQGKDGPIKIGSTTNITKRLKELQQANPNTLHIMHTTTGGQNLERHLHKIFSKYRIIGEWFEPVDEILMLIENFQFEDELYGKLKSIVTYAIDEGYQIAKDEREILVMLTRGAWLESGFEVDYKIKMWEILENYCVYQRHFPSRMIQSRRLDVFRVEGIQSRDIEIRRERNIPRII
jgi:Meiotically up-regulated gene 113